MPVAYQADISHRRVTMIDADLADCLIELYWIVQSDDRLIGV